MNNEEMKQSDNNIIDENVLGIETKKEEETIIETKPKVNSVKPPKITVPKQHEEKKEDDTSNTKVEKTINKPESNTKETISKEEPVTKNKIIFAEDDLNNKNNQIESATTDEYIEDDIEKQQEKIIEDLKSIENKTLEFKEEEIVDTNIPKKSAIFSGDLKNEENIIPDESIQNQEKVDELSKNFWDKTTKTGIYGNKEGEVASVSAESPTVKKIKSFDIPPDKIKILSDPNIQATAEKAFKAQYLDITQSPIVPRYSRVPFIMSGYYADFGAYSYGDLINYVNILTNPDMKTSERLLERMKNVYKYLQKVSFSEERPTLDIWLKKTKIADLNQAMYGVFDATYPGKSTYNISCGHSGCGHRFDVEKTNKELNFALQKGMRPDFIVKVLKGQLPKEELLTTPIYKDAQELYEGKVISEYNYKISYGVPSIYETYEWLLVFEEILFDSFENFDALFDEEKEGHNLLKLFTYISKVTVPVIIGKSTTGEDIINFYCIDGTVDNQEKRLENKKQILQLLMGLPKNLLAELFTGKEVAEKLKLEGIIHMLHNIKCPNCGSNLIRIRLDIGLSFFIEASQTVGKISTF
jgi:hypothetical protein